MNPVLEEMYATSSVQDQRGDAHPFHGGVTADQARVLESLCRQERPATTLEVGLAYGASALAILEGKAPRGGAHYAIDPFQSSQWDMLGAESIRRAGFEGEFHLLEERDSVALPRLIAEGLQIDLAFIDGDHAFEATMLDWLCIDQLLVKGGLLVFHDYPLPGVYYAVRVALNSGRYQRITDWDIRRTRPRRLASGAIDLVRYRLNPLVAFAAVAANTQMPVLRKLG